MSNSLSVSVQTCINAPLEKAWQVLTDFGSYHTWHPVLTLESHAGPLAVGTLLQGQSSGGPAGEQPVAFAIALVQEPNHLAWTGGDPEVVAGRHSFQLEELADGTTEFIESEVFTGPAAPEVIGGQLPELHATYETFAAAFKKCVEEALAEAPHRRLRERDAAEDGRRWLSAANRNPGSGGEQPPAVGARTERRSW
jgi:hypothetical protein